MLPSETFGSRIKDLRIKKGLTAQQLADMMYVSRSTVSRWENGNRLPDISMLNRLAKCLEVEAGELVNAIGPSDETPTVLIVDDENIILKGNMRVLTEIIPKAHIHGFSRASEALAFADSTTVDIAFVDIELKGGESGLDLAAKLLEIHPRTNIIFTTGYSQYTSDAWDVHASGYLIKPLSPDKVRKELSCLRYPVKGVL